MIQSKRRQLILGSAAGTLLTVGGGRAFAQAADFPSRMVNYIVPFAAGGLSDLIARMVGDGVRRHHNQNVVVEAKPGANGAVAIEALRRAKPDGYTWLGLHNGFWAVSPFLYKLAWNPVEDLIPVAMTGDAYMAMFVHPSVPANTLAELVAYAKANPGRLNYGSSGLGGVSHMSGEYLKKRAGIDITHIPYKGSPAALQACLGNEVQIIFGPEGAQSALAGKLKTIMILGSKRWSKLPGAPTSDEAGMPNWVLRSWHAAAVLGGTPPDVVTRINALFNRILAEPPVVEKIQQMGLEPASLSVAEIGERIKVDRAQIGALIKELGITGGEP